MPRPDNVVVACFAGGPAQSQPTSAASTTTCDFTKDLSDADWVAQRYSNFKAFVGSLVVQEPKLEEWSLWLDRVPLGVFLAGGDGELRGVRGATTDEKRAEEAGLVLERWALDYQFELDRISTTDLKKLRRYIELFAVA